MKKGIGLILMLLALAATAASCDDNESSSDDKEYVPVNVVGTTIYFEKIR